MMNPFTKVITAFVFALLAAISAAASSPFANIPVVGNLKNSTSQTATFAGTVDVYRFVFLTPPVSKVEAFVTLTGQVTDSTGNVIETLDRVPMGPLPVTFVTASCSLLKLQLAPIGIITPSGGYTGEIASPGSTMIVVPDITPGSNEAVSDILCTIAGLVANGGPVARLARELNLLIGLLA